jgi:predicted dehydrogenase
MDKKWVNVAVIGTGRIYNDAHRSCYANEYSKNMVLIGLCDLRDDLAKKQLKWIKKKYKKDLKKAKKDSSESAERIKFGLDNLKIYSDYSKMLDQLEGTVDLIDNCTHGRGHIMYSIQAMNHGIHACAEKPPGVNWWDVKRAVEAEKKTGKYFQLNENECYNRPVQKAREVVQAGTIGKIDEVTINFGHGGPYVPYVIGETGLPHFIDPILSGGGCLQDLAPHGISKAFWPIYQPGAKVISCKTKILERRKNPRIMSGQKFESPVDDWAEAELVVYDPRTNSNYDMEITTSWCGGFPHPMSIEGEEGILTIGGIPKSKDQGAVIYPMDDNEDIKYIAANQDEWEPRRTHTREIQFFCQNILEGKPSDTNSVFALALQEILSIHYFSKLKNKNVTLEEMNEWGQEIANESKTPQDAIDKISIELVKAVDLK